MKYDDAFWHYKGDFPKGLPKINGATHIGLFLTWCITNDLLSEENNDDFEKEIKAVKNRKLSGAEFLMANFDGKFCSEDLNNVGNGFTKAYYQDSTTFSKKQNDFLADLGEIMKIKSKNGFLDSDSFYRIKNSWKNYDLIKPIIEQRFNEWKEFKGKK